MLRCTGYAAETAQAPLAPFTFERRDPGPTDVRIDITHCGVCHSDIHTARSEWGPSLYPCVPGHEIVGRVAEVGGAVTRFKAGDLVGVGCMVDSCRECSACKADMEQFCEKGMTGTYNSPDPHTGGHTLGGYSKAIVVDQHFVLRVPEGLDPAVELIAVADCLPPAALKLLRTMAPLSSMTWLVNLLTPLPVTTDGWWLLQARADHARGGSSSQVMRVWDADGRAVAEQMQSVAIFG